MPYVKGFWVNRAKENIFAGLVFNRYEQAVNNNGKFQATCHKFQTPNHSSVKLFNIYVMLSLSKYKKIYTSWSHFDKLCVTFASSCI
jgi:hypothetical protein